MERRLARLARRESIRLTQSYARKDWSALEESNFPHRGKGPVHSHYAKDGVVRPAQKDTNSRPTRSYRAALISVGRNWRRSQDLNLGAVAPSPLAKERHKPLGHFSIGVSDRVRTGIDQIHGLALCIKLRSPLIFGTWRRLEGSNLHALSGITGFKPD